MTVHQFPPTPIALLVDNDLGFVFWLGTIFAEAGYQAVPALTCRAAVLLIQKLNLKVDLVVVNPGLSGVSQMIQTLSHPHRRPKIIVISDADVDDAGTIPRQGIFEMPAVKEVFLHHEWLDRVRRILLDVPATDAE